LNKKGDLFVSYSVLGMVWRIPRNGSGPAEPWFADPLLEPCTAGDVGANGVAFWKDSLYVANTANRSAGANRHPAGRLSGRGRSGRG